MTDQSEGYVGKRHLIWRNLIGFLLGCVGFAFGWCMAIDTDFSVLSGVLFGALAWVGVMFVTAKGH